MFCPRCGQQQAPGSVRFCSRCGFPLDGVLQLLNKGGMLPVNSESDAPKEMSARRRGVRQGGMLFLLGMILVPVLGVFASYSRSPFPELLAAIAAIICFLGGPLRMLYAAVFEEGAPNPFHARPYVQSPNHVPQFNPQMRNTALPPPSAQQGLGWRQRPVTAELATPPSVTENTTRLLDREERSEKTE